MPQAISSITKSLARAALPNQHYDALSFAARRIRRRNRASDVHVALDKTFVAHYGPIVRDGPFKGLNYDPVFVGHTTAVAAKLLGAYESELHPTIRRILASDMSVFVDIGCAEGYYAAGVAFCRADVRVIAFDIDPAARRMCQMLARRNQVSVDVRCEATMDYLASLEPGAVVFSDCEGAEAYLLDPFRATSLVDLTLIVEIHDFVDPGISALMRARFGSTHEVTEVNATPRYPARYAELASFTDNERDLALSEGRPTKMSWYIMEPHSRPKRPG